MSNEMVGPPMVSPEARKLWAAAVEDAASRFSCYPRWIESAFKIGIGIEEAVDLCTELEDCDVISRHFPSTIPALEVMWPLAKQGRLPANEWRVVRARIFERDSYTCTYCGARGVKLECDHIVPVARGGSFLDENLTTACFTCNRSKRDKLVSEWRAA